jgi:hypothetical protein
MTLVTVYALFFDDIRIIAFSKQADLYFNALTLIALVSFLIELLLASIAIHGYVNSFFFWLDLISALSMLPDLGWIYQHFMNGSTTIASGTRSFVKLARTARVARAIRAIRLLRLFRYLKLYKEMQQTQKHRLEAIVE